MIIKENKRYCRSEESKEKEQRRHPIGTKRAPPCIDFLFFAKVFVRLALFFFFLTIKISKASIKQGMDRLPNQEGSNKIYLNRKGRWTSALACS